jgi:hypothetical protein
MRYMRGERNFMKNRNRRGKRKAAEKASRRSGPKYKLTPPRSANEFFALPEHAQDKWTRITHVISTMRAEDVSLPEGSGEFGLDPRTVSQLARPALRKLRNGRWAARAHDRLLRVLVIPTSGRLREVAVRDSRQASLLGEYWAAVQKYLETGDASDLRKIRRKTITDSDGKRVRLVKDLGVLERLGSAGVLSFESIYAKAA